MTMQKNEALVRGLFDEVLNAGNLARAQDIVASRSIDHGPSMIGCAGGAEGFERTIGMFRNAMPDLSYSIDDLIAKGDKVVVRWTALGTFTGKLRHVGPTGKRASVTGIVIYRVAGHLIEESWGNWDALGMMEQLGILDLGALR